MQEGEGKWVFKSNERRNDGQSCDDISEGSTLIDTLPWLLPFSFSPLTISHTRDHKNWCTFDSIYLLIFTKNIKK